MHCESYLAAKPTATLNMKSTHLASRFTICFGKDVQQPNAQLCVHITMAWNNADGLEVLKEEEITHSRLRITGLLLVVLQDFT